MSAIPREIWWRLFGGFLGWSAGLAIALSIVLAVNPPRPIPAVLGVVISAVGLVLGVVIMDGASTA